MLIRNEAALVGGTDEFPFDAVSFAESAVLFDVREDDDDCGIKSETGRCRGPLSLWNRFRIRKNWLFGFFFLFAAALFGAGLSAIFLELFFSFQYTTKKLDN